MSYSDQITTNETLIQIKTNKGNISANACIITVSTGVLNSGKIKFNPKLPEEKYDIALDVFNEFFSKVEKFNYSLIEFIDLRLPEKFIVRFYQDGNVNILDDI